MITDQQVKLLRFFMNKYKNHKLAAAKSGMSERTARKYLNTSLIPSQLKKKHDWQTRVNVFDSVWDKVTQMITLSPKLNATTILTYLTAEYPEKFSMSNLRALQRRIQHWKSLNGSDKEIIFPQKIEAGHQSQSDYTHMDSLGVTIAGKAFPHLLFHFMFPYCKWEDAKVCFTESFNSLTEGYEQAVWKFGRQAPEHRTDNQSAVSTSINGKMIFTEKWKEFTNHYGIVPTTNNPGRGHENGSVEKSHDLLKKAIEQELLMRGSRNFSTQKEYEDFVEAIIEGRNKQRRELISKEISLLKELPCSKYNAPDLLLARVSNASTVKIIGGIYSVPSRLIGYQLKACIYRSTIELYYGRRLVQSMPRLSNNEHHAINYRHIIKQLVRKPGAFESYKYRDCLFPSAIFRKAYDSYKKIYPSSGHKHYLKILELAALHGENRVSKILEQDQDIAENRRLDIGEITKRLTKEEIKWPLVRINATPLNMYDVLVEKLSIGGAL